MLQLFKLSLYEQNGPKQKHLPFSTLLSFITAVEIVINLVKRLSSCIAYLAQLPNKRTPYETEQLFVYKHGVVLFTLFH